MSYSSQACRRVSDDTILAWAMQMTPYCLTHKHLFTCLNVKLDSALITELVHLFPQGKIKAEKPVLKVNIFELFSFLEKTDTDMRTRSPRCFVSDSL